MKKKYYWIVGIIIIAILFGGYFIFSPRVCGIKNNEWNWNYDVSYCDKSCNTDDDCEYNCGCGAINKNETCDWNGWLIDCISSEVKCVKNKCTAT